MNQPLSEIFRYNRWANEQLIEACRALTDEQLDTRAPGTSGSVRELLLHVVGGQQTFVLRTKGRQHEGELGRASAWPGFDVLVELARQSSDQLIAIAEALVEDSEVTLAYRGRGYRYPTSFFLVHAAEHGVEHRTEIKVALAQLGIETPDLDAWYYGGAAGYGKEVAG
ncbi:MAG TPA: DinB family protein [Candidatus Dormibacteraeota bacterium]|nr:DinB family protein [Candidatus Dormibacteraeota bacterium]